jgi:hypothetical protein
VKICKRGHKNRWRKNAQGYEVCRACHEIANQKWRRKAWYYRKAGMEK